MKRLVSSLPSPSSMSIDKDQFDDLGFVIMQNVLPEELIKQIVREICLVIRDQMLKSGIKISDIVATDDELLVLVKSAFIPGSDLREFLYHFLRHVPSLHALMTSEFIAELLQVLGFQMPVTLEIPSLRFDAQGEEQYLTQAHQDLRSIRGRKTATIWAPITLVNEQVGTAFLYPGSHKAGLIPINHDDAYIRVDDLDKLGKPIVVDAKPGDMIVFNSFCVHGSIPAKQKGALRINAQIFWNDAMEINPRDDYYALHKISDFKDMLNRG